MSADDTRFPPLHQVDSNRQAVGGARAGASWSSTEAGVEDGKDYLAALGNTDYNTNVDVGIPPPPLPPLPTHPTWCVLRASAAYW